MWIDARCSAPTSPQKFNASTKIVLDELKEIQIQEHYGNLRKIKSNHKFGICRRHWLISNSNESAVYLVSQKIKNYGRIGLEINAEKSVTIIIENGVQKFNDLVIDNNTNIRAVQAGEIIKYLDVTFADKKSSHNGIERLFG